MSNSNIVLEIKKKGIIAALSNELQIRKDSLVLEILEAALNFAIKCPMCKKVIDGSFRVIRCPICNTSYCLIPCSRSLAFENQKCIVCNSYNFSEIRLGFEYLDYLKKLELLRKEGKVEREIYKKIKNDYNEKIRKYLGIEKKS
jgi:phage FluMu protein Com